MEQGLYALKLRKNYVTKPKRSYEISLRFQAPNLPIFIFILSKILCSSHLFTLFPPSTKTNHSSPPTKSCRNNFSKIQIENHVQKKRGK
jgi:hypothetical protein